MEIDFLGLNSKTKYDNMEGLNSKDIAIVTTDTDNLGVETSLSLSTRPSFYCHREILNFSEKKKRNCYTSAVCSLTEQPSILLVPPPVFRPSATTPATAGFLYNLNDKSTELRNMFEIQAEPASFTMLYSGCANVLNGTLPEKAENSMYIAGNNATPRLSDRARICKRTGYTPTVAMARRATLARFLEKRLHRMNQARATHLMGKSLNATNSKASDTTVITRSNDKTNNILKR